MKKRVLSVCAAVFLCGSATWAADIPGYPAHGPLQLQAQETRRGADVLCQTTSASVPSGLLAVVTLPGPPDAKDTWFEIRSFAPQSLRYAILSGYGGLAGHGLCYCSAQPIVHPSGGSLRIDHPGTDESGMGPAMVAFSGFDGGECSGFQATIGTWGDPEFHARVADLVGSRVDLVFEGDLRGSADFQLCTSKGYIRDRFHEVIACTPGSVLAVIVE